MAINGFVMKNSATINFSPSFKRLLLGIGILNGIIGIKRIVESFFFPDIYRKDFASPYLMGKAILNGVDPYLPLPELVNRWISHTGYNSFNHPTPHTPLVGMLSVPLGFLSYENAAVVWLLIQLISLIVSLLLLSYWWGRPVKLTNMVVLLVIALGWLPLAHDLYCGQVNTHLLLLSLIAWFSLREGKDGLGGAMLGGLIALKLTAWPIVLFLALRRRWTAVATAATIVIAANLGAIAVIGFDGMKNYYLKVGPLVAAMYRAYDVNYSTWTIGQRFFAGFGNNFFAQPLWESELLARLFTVLAPLAVLSAGLWRARKAKSFDTSFGILVGVGILVSPVVWTHYLTLAIIPVVILARRIGMLGWPKLLSHLAFSVLFFLSIMGTGYSQLAYFCATGVTPEGLSILPFAAGLVTLIPAVALVCVLCLVWRLDDVALPQQNWLARRVETISAFRLLRARLRDTAAVRGRTQI